MKALRRGPPRLLLGVIGVLLIAGSGVVYAAWQQTVTISGSVTTGSLTFHWVKNPGITFCSATPPNTGGATASAKRDDDPGPGGDPTLLHVTVDKAYPGMQVFCSLVMENMGTIPGTLATITLTNTLNLTNCIPSSFGSGTKKLTCNEMTITYFGSVPSAPVAPGSFWGQTLSIEIPLSANPPMNTSFTFTAQTQITQ